MKRAVIIQRHPAYVKGPKGEQGLTKDGIANQIAVLQRLTGELSDRGLDILRALSSREERAKAGALITTIDWGGIIEDSDELSSWWADAPAEVNRAVMELKEHGMSIEMALLTCPAAEARLQEAGIAAANMLLAAVSDVLNRGVVYASTHGGTVAEATILAIMELLGRGVESEKSFSQWFCDVFMRTNMDTSDAVLLVVDGQRGEMSLAETIYIAAS